MIDKNVNADGGKANNRDKGKLIVRMGTTEQEAAQRLEALDNMAAYLNLDSRSELIRMIADGRFALVVPNISFFAANEVEKARVNGVGK